LSLLASVNDEAMTIYCSKGYPSTVPLGRNSFNALGIIIAILAAFNSVLLSQNSNAGSIVTTNSSINDLWIPGAEYPLAADKNAVEATVDVKRRSRAHFKVSS
jgi:hypothetical protein